MRSDPEKAARLREQARAFALSKFGITTEQYDLLLAHQGGVCAICLKECMSGRRLAVDHDHETGRVRGLLCTPCNNHLGVYEAVRDRAAIYLKANGDGNPLLSGEGTHAPVSTGRWPGGSHGGKSKLTEELAAEIRSRYATGAISQRLLALEFGISQNTVGIVVRGIRWASGSETRARGQKAFVPRARKLSNADVEAIRVRHANGESKKSIARSLGMAPSSITYRLRDVPTASEARAS